MICVGRHLILFFVLTTLLCCNNQSNALIQHASRCRSFAQSSSLLHISKRQNRSSSSLAALRGIAGLAHEASTNIRSSTITTASFQQRFKKSLLSKSTLLLSSIGSEEDENEALSNPDPVLRDVASRLNRANWISWWCQVILTVISSITLLFARSVLTALGGVSAQAAPGGFLFAGTGIVLSYLSIIWTWGGTRLARRLRRNNSSKVGFSRIKAATMIRRAIAIGATLNCFGMLITLIGAEQIVGLLAAKVLTMQGVSPFQAFGGGAGFGLGTAQSVQPLDVLIVQANTNTLLSHFLSLICSLILTRSVHVLDPPSVEDDE